MPNIDNIHPPFRDNGRFAQNLARWITKLIGWDADFWDLLDSKRVIVTGVPHTSNMDSILMIIFAAAMGRRLRWVVKKELAWEPLGTIIRATGGIFIDRRSRAGLVGQIAEIVKASESIFLVIAPEGTRSYTDKWKSGFYYIAVDADVPIVLAHLNYQRKRFGARAPFMPTGDLKADEVLIRDYYAQWAGARYPEKFGPIVMDVPRTRRADRNASKATSPVADANESETTPEDESTE